jgi:hypothetical protein
MPRRDLIFAVKPPTLNLPTYLFPFGSIRRLIL